jgi:aspartyl-tRNA(Asn)/glutamyl-tRNA(Gln) amidotransferase subunit B
MEKGSLRCDANISIRPRGDARLGTKVELKNMNSFRNVRSALEFEAARQLAAAEDGEKITQETRLWNADKGTSNPMRSKEEAEDYRYFPEPDLVPFVVDRAAIEAARKALPELPEAKAARFEKDFGLSKYDAGVITGDIDMAEYFEEATGLYPNKKAIANWMMGDMLAELKEKDISIRELGIPPNGLVNLLSMIDSGAIRGKMAKDVLKEAIGTKSDPKDIVARKGLSQVSDRSEIESMVKAVISKNSKSADDYRSGKKNALAFLVGQVMKESAGKANPAIVNEMLRKELGG